MILIIYYLLLTFSNAFINKYIYPRLSKINSMRMPIKESNYIYKHKISINYKLTNDQVNLIQNNINQHDDRFIIYSTYNEYMLSLNLFVSKIDQTIIYNSYLSILVKDKYINIYGEYILNRLEPIKYQTINKTNPFYYFYSNESSISLHIDDKLINDNDKLINDKYNLKFIYDNSTNNINYISFDIKPINRYIVNTSYLSKLIYQNMTFYKADKITYTKDEYMYESFR